jgi:hypothetical protein
MLKNNMISADCKFFDLKSGCGIPYSDPFHRKEMDDEQGENNICTADGVSSVIRISKMREKIQRGIQGQSILLSGTILCHGVCADSIQGESAGYRIMSGCARPKALSYWE